MMLDRRVEYYSNHTVNRFIDLFEDRPDVDNSIRIQDLIILFSSGSPRDSIRLTQRIFRSYLDALNRDAITIEMCQAKIPVYSVHEGIATFSRERFVELLPVQEMRRQMESVHRVCLTSSTFTTSVQKISANAANSKIASWKQTGAVRQIGDIMMNRTGKPNRLYTFSDPRSAFCASGTTLDKFCENKVRRCSHCSAIQIRDWDIGNQHGQCTACQGVLESNGRPSWEPPSPLLRAVRRELTAALPDASYVRLIADDLGFEIDDLEAEQFASVEMWWKWLLNSSIDLGPEKFCELVNEVMERVPSDKTEQLALLKKEADHALTNAGLYSLNP